MGLSINQNIAAVNAYHNLANTQNDLSKSLEKLSSGFRINRAADDAAGLAISEGLRSQIGGLKVAVRNAQDGTSVVQTAEGALNESTSILQRMRDLSVQASNDGGLSADAKGNIQSEMGQLKSELSRIADTTTFNGTKLLDGSYTGSFQVGANVGERINVGVATSMGAVGLGVGGVDVTTAASAGYISGLKVGDTIAATAATNTSITPTAALLNAVKGGAFSIDGLAVDTTSLNGTTDSAATVAAAINGTSGMSAKATASVDSTGKLVLTSASTGSTGTAAQVTVTGAEGLALFTGSPVAGADAKTATATDVAANDLLAGGADKAIKAIDAAISTVSTVRANLGAVQNRFDHTVKNLNVAVENLSASESRIRDTDMASEMVAFTRSQILSQAGTSMLAQANQLPQSVLKLLG